MTNSKKRKAISGEELEGKVERKDRKHKPTKKGKQSDDNDGHARERNHSASTIMNSSKNKVTEDSKKKPANQSFENPETLNEGGNGGQRVAKKKPTLLEQMKTRLQGGQFRMLNEKMYTSQSEDAFSFFSRDKQSFFKYHSGYKEQTCHWPKLPVDVVIDWLKHRSSDLVVADFGCGEAKLASSLENTVFSLDFVAAKPGVIECNMAETPLKTESVSVAVFCLSLMGVDYGSFLLEAHRVLKEKGWLLIAEVKSRLDPENGGADPEDFLKALSNLGFKLKKQDTSNKMFLLFFLQKVKNKFEDDEIEWPALKPCVYKKR